MSQQHMPNPIEMYEASAKQARKVISGVKPNQLSQPTPCSYWTVAGLMAHMVEQTSLVKLESKKKLRSKPWEMLCPLNFNSMQTLESVLLSF